MATQSSWGWQQNGEYSYERKKKNSIFAEHGWRQMCGRTLTFPVREKAKSLLTLNPLTHESIHAKQFNDQMKQWLTWVTLKWKKRVRPSLMHSRRRWNSNCIPFYVLVAQWIESVCADLSSRMKWFGKRNTETANVNMHWTRQILECTCIRNSDLCAELVALARC